MEDMDRGELAISLIVKLVEAKREMDSSLDDLSGEFLSASEGGTVKPEMKNLDNFMRARKATKTFDEVMEELQEFWRQQTGFQGEVFGD